MPKTVVVSYGSRYGGTVMSKELFEYMGVHLAPEEIQQRIAEQRARFERALVRERLERNIAEMCERVGLVE